MTGLPIVRPRPTTSRRSSRPTSSPSPTVGIFPAVGPLQRQPAPRRGRGHLGVPRGWCRAGQGHEGLRHAEAEPGLVPLHAGVRHVRLRPGCGLAPAADPR
ncbi:hypothetical protein QJS66_00285 [Kocuria rhizophila]|nr:hypothetical protein QJS66_00285 [Kocuria rhizophila]